MSRVSRRSLRVLPALGLTVVLAACAQPDEPDDAAPTEPPATGTPEPGGSPEPGPTGTAEPDAGVDPLTEDRGLDPSEGEAGGGLLTVTDVRIGTHEGFDRIVFEIEGEGPAGWLVHYVDDPRTQGKGAPVEIAGEAFLEVILRGIALPPDVPDRDQWDGERLQGPAGGTVVELVEDTIFEGQQVFHIGLPRELPFAVTRLDDPQRIVVEIDHG